MYIIPFIEKCTTGEIRLNGGYYFGQVQVCVGGVWGAICLNNYWNNSDASVVCKQLGFSPYGTIFNQHNINLKIIIILLRCHCCSQPVVCGQ